ncbi:S26 family signal peptidase [Cryobacterium zongtaii]|nr:S26 family signal peptidase [Cryobacterium zongtaii]
MEPLIKAGDIVLSEPMDADAPPPLGLVVSFPAPAGAAVEGTVLHRVVGANEDGSLITAGDANQSVDSVALERTDIISQARLLVPWIGLPAFWLTTAAVTPLVLWLIGTAAAVAIVAVDGAANPRPPRTPRPPRVSGRNRARRVPPGEVVALGMISVLIAAAFLAAPPTPAIAAFSATTTTAGNSWETAGPATQLVFKRAPSGSTGGIPMATQPVVAIQNAAGETVSSTAKVALTLTNQAGATLTCTANPVAAVAGLATFAGCRVDRAGTYTLTARSGALPATVSTAFTIRVGPAAKLVYATQPGSAAVDSAFAAQPAVAIQDVGGNTVSTTVAVTLALTSPAGASLACTTNPRSAVAGTATFAGCKINRPGSYTLTATATGLTSAVSTAVVITAGPASRLVFTTSPAGASGGSAFGTQPVVTVRDAGGNTVASSTPVTLRLTTSAGATLTCAANPASSATGIVSFAGCAIDRAGTYTLTASSGTLTTAVSASFTVKVGVASKLGFISAPSSTRYNTTFDTQPQIAIQDAGGNTVVSSAAVTLRLTAAGGATLYCTTNPRSAVSGVATFSGCRIDRAGSYTFTATSGTLTPAVSANYTVTPGPATKLAFSVNPSGASGGTAFSGQPIVLVQDAGGNTVASTAAVALSLTTANGATLNCTVNPVSAQSGKAIFAGCAVNRSGSYTLRAVSGSLTAATSAPFTVATGPAARLIFSASPGTATSGTTFATTPTVAVQDAGGNAVAASGMASLSLTTAAGATVRCAVNPAAASFGVRFSFPGCSIDKAGTYTLTATSGTLASAVSSSFTVTPGAASKLIFVTPPSGGTVNQIWAIQPVVAIQDANGNNVDNTASVTLRLTTPAGATLTCASNPLGTRFGEATFSSCRTNRAATYTLTATSGTLTAAVSPGFTIVP